MDGKNYRAAAAAHRDAPDETLIREHLEAYRRAHVNYVRDGGDPYGAGLLARELAGNTGSPTVRPGLPYTGKGAMERLWAAPIQTGKSTGNC